MRGAVYYNYIPGVYGSEGPGMSMWSVSSLRGDERLQLSGCEVRWWEGSDPTSRRLKRVLSVETPVLQAFWCQFGCSLNERRQRAAGRGGGDEEVLQQCVCIRESSCLTLFMASGAIHNVPLPFVVGIFSSIFVVTRMVAGY